MNPYNGSLQHPGQVGSPAPGNSVQTNSASNPRNGLRAPPPVRVPNGINGTYGYAAVHQNLIFQRHGQLFPRYPVPGVQVTRALVIAAHTFRYRAPMPVENLQEEMETLTLDSSSEEVETMTLDTVSEEVEGLTLESASEEEETQQVPTDQEAHTSNSEMAANPQQ